jgi:threonine aldolase
LALLLQSEVIDADREGNDMNHADSPRRRQLASDTYAGVCTEAMQALIEANVGHAAPYGDDPWTARATQLLCELFEQECAAFIVGTGTAANSLALAAICQPFHSVICHADAHIQTDECGAPEYLGGGLKLVPIPGEHGKLTPDAIREAAAKRRDVHSSKPRAISISQATEVGTVYTAAEVRALGDTAHELGLRLHMDGARFANAVASLDCPPRALTWQAGVDVLSFGGTKNGLAAGDAVIFFDRGMAEEFAYRRKQAGQLFAKMRYFSAPWVALLESRAWLRNARHANAMAQLLASELLAIPRMRILHPVEANAVFVQMPAGWSEALQARGWHYYHIADGDRLMCSWDTQEEDITAFIADLKELATEERR